MLDHMLVSRPLFDRFERIEIHNEALKDELRDYRRSANLSESHHAPVVACFDPTGGARRGAGSPLRGHRPAPK
jgi:exonuclease III